LSDRLESAVHEVEEVVPDLSEVVRVDVDEAGEVMLTALCAAGTRWFTHDDRGLIERHPERDDKLPLAARLRSTSDWKVLSYRPGRRAVVLVRHGERVNVLKGHKRSRSARAAVHQGCAEGAMRRGAFRVPRLLSHDGQHEALVFEYLPAREVELDSASAALYRTLGVRLAVFQGDECAGDLAVFGPRDELAVLERWKEKVLRVVPELPEGWSDVHARLERHASTLPPPRLGLCHRDLHDRQVHSDGTEVALLDFDLLCRADVALDPGNLIAHLRWRALQGLHGADARSVRVLEDAFREGYGRESEDGFVTRLAFYCASAFLRLSLVYRLRPRWSGRVGELVSRASAALDDLAPVG
jgi:tRNA A-37 threonylcarbamoyl transferase component Bud32